MSVAGLKKLIEAFADVDTLPVEVEDIQNKIVDLGFQDEIIIDGRPGDPGRIRGVFYQFTKRPVLYGDTVLCTLIGFNTANDIQWQRISCAKELMHIFDDDLERTDKLDELEALVEKILGPMSTDDLGVADLMAMKDKFALYECLPILFPMVARSACLQRIEDSTLTREEIVTQACIPAHFCELVLSKEWPKLLSLLTDC